MKNIIKIFIISILLCSSNLWAGSYEDTTYKLLELINFDAAVAKTTDSMLNMIKQETPEQETLDIVHQEKIIKDFLHLCLIKDNYLKDQIAGVYQNYYTEEELHELIKILKENTVCKKFIYDSLEIMDVFSEIIKARLLKKQDILITMIEKSRQELPKSDSSSSDSEELYDD